MPVSMQAVVIVKLHLRTNGRRRKLAISQGYCIVKSALAPAKICSGRQLTPIVVPVRFVHCSGFVMIASRLMNRRKEAFARICP